MKGGNLVNKIWMMKRRLLCALLLALLMASSGCGYLVAAGAGATGGYILRDQGYEVQSPVEKAEEEEDKK
jgi:ABC-type sugar transport system substrate-binding protein